MRQTQIDLEVQELAEKIQQECHQTVELIMKDVKDCNVQDATNVFLFRKLAEIVVRMSNYSHGRRV